MFGRTVSLGFQNKELFIIRFYFLCFIAVSVHPLLHRMTTLLLSPTSTTFAAERHMLSCPQLHLARALLSATAKTPSVAARRFLLLLPYHSSPPHRAPLLCGGPLLRVAAPSHDRTHASPMSGPKGSKPTPWQTERGGCFFQVHFTLVPCESAKRSSMRQIIWFSTVW